METFRFELENETIEVIARNLASACKKAEKHFKRLGFICIYRQDIIKKM